MRPPKIIFGGFPFVKIQKAVDNWGKYVIIKSILQSIYKEEISMLPIELIAQGVGIVAMATNVLSYQQKSKKHFFVTS